MADPFRLVTELTGYDADGAQAVWHPSGGEFGALGEVPRPSEVPSILVLEAMTQCAGLFLQRTHDSPGTHWMLTGVDNADVDRVGWDDPVTLDCTVHKRSTRAAVLIVSAGTDQGEVSHATILMHRVAR
jgi:3-hydroxymyristoyl/3-hydroxydecanoyl-(acyl carrier protein) dehydratase